MKKKAIFIDRDGIIIKLCYDRELGIIHTPINSKQVEFVPGIFEFLKKAKKNNFLLIVISNQPGIGIKKMSWKQFVEIERKINKILRTKGILLNAQYYCLHHPFAKIKKYRKICNCRKPNTMLYDQAIAEFNIDIRRSWGIGDGVFDIIAGEKVGVKTIFVTNIYEASYLEILEKELKGNKPNFLVKNLEQAAKIITNY